MTPDCRFVGFGFGAIQAGLLLYEASRSGRFSRLVVAEVMPDVVEAIRANGGRYGVNIATRTGIERREVAGIEILNPSVPSDREALVRAVSEAGEIATALPSVSFYGTGGATSVLGILSEGLARKASDPALPDAVIYTAENHNHAAETLADGLRAALGTAYPAVSRRAQALNTVIGKMSSVVTDRAQIADQALAPIAPGRPRCFLVEEFNRILITRIDLPGFQRGISVFEEKADLLPFEEAKLYGHNATHALLGYLAALRKLPYMADASRHAELIEFARSAFVEESGAALCRRHAGLDPLFTPAGYRAYVEDLMVRMVNPHLRDSVERVTRDPRRKLGWEDRLVGTMRLAREQGVTPARYAVGAAAALRLLAAAESVPEKRLLETLWSDAKADRGELDQIVAWIAEATARLD